MVRDEIQIAAEREYAVRTGREEGREEGHAAGLEEGHAAGLEEGHAAGLEEGRAEANLKTARTLKQAGADIELISQCTGLSAEEVEAL